MNNDIFTQLAEKYPFITLCVYATTEYLGIIQNQDETITTIYDFGSIQDLDTKKKFLELANIVAGASLVLANQNFVYSLAMGLGKQTVLETIKIKPLQNNECFFPRENTQYF